MSEQESYHEVEFSIVDGGPLNKGLKRVKLNKPGAHFLGLRRAALRVIRYLLLLIVTTWALPILAQEAQAADLSALIAPSKQDATEASPVEFMNRSIFTIRSEFMGYTQEERAISVRDRIKSAMEKGGDDHVSIRPTPEGGRFIELNGLAVFQIRPGDLDPLTGESVDETAKNAAENLRIAVGEAREQGNSHILLKGSGLFVLASVFFYGVCRFIYWLESRIIKRLQSWMQVWEGKLTVAVRPQQALNVLVFVARFAKWALVIMAGYEWATFSLRQFPYTRPWGETLHSYLIDTITGILSAIVDALPGLLVVFLIVLLTRLTSQLLKAFFARIESGEVTVPWMAEETARPTRKLTQALLWLFAFAMAYPYFPGSNTEAFKGLSVLVGIMLSIGGAGVVGQAASGLIMIYSRVLREGEYVKIGEIEGLVTLVGIFSTKIRTANGEEINVPNSLIGNSTTVNSSRLAEGKGLVLHTVVTIGYNTPWRQVHAMLMRAAGSTPGLRTEPKPFVIQSALSDFYVEYRLCMQIERPEIRRITLTALHANIQDVFNEFGVQIMSPHYENDPLEKVWVPKEQWFEAPAEDGVDGESV
ncbi:MAG: mechanosensitive ion channel domain-containing protein [Methylococcaceae bacterium]|jgi:small-conductance mechanosensitive channel